MKFSWVNILATLLIVGGVVTMIANWRLRPAQHIPTDQEAKAAIQKKMETLLGRPLSEPETEMFEVTRIPDKPEFTLDVHEPLKGRLAEASRQAKAATQASTSPPSSSGGGTPGDAASTLAPVAAPSSNAP